MFFVHLRSEVLKTEVARGGNFCVNSSPCDMATGWPRKVVRAYSRLGPQIIPSQNTLVKRLFYHYKPTTSFAVMFASMENMLKLTDRC